MFTLYYFIIIKVAWSVGLRICSYFGFDESILEQRAEQKNATNAEEPVDICLFRAHRESELWHAEVTRVSENKRSSSAATYYIRIPVICQDTFNTI